MLDLDVGRSLRVDFGIHAVNREMRTIDWAHVRASNASSIIRQRLRTTAQSEPKCYTLDEAFDHISEFVTSWGLSDRLERSFKWELPITVDLLEFLKSANDKLADIPHAEAESVLLALIRDQKPAPKKDEKRERSPRQRVTVAQSDGPRRKAPRVEEEFVVEKREKYSTVESVVPVKRARNGASRREQSRSDEELSKPLPKSAPAVRHERSTAAAASSSRDHRQARRLSPPKEPRERRSNPPYAPRNQASSASGAPRQERHSDSLAAVDARLRAFAREHKLDQKSAQTLRGAMPAVSARDLVDDPLWARGNRPSNVSAYVIKCAQQHKSPNAGESVEVLLEHAKEFVSGWSLEERAEKCILNELPISVEVIKWLAQTNEELGRATGNLSSCCVQRVQETKKQHAVPQQTEEELLREYRNLEEKLKRVQASKSSTDRRPDDRHQSFRRR